jgi:hypothetical protein
VAISALLVLALGSGYGAIRLVDTLLGAVVGVLVNALVAPPTHVQSAASEICRVAEDLGLLLADVGRGLRAGWDHRAAQDWLRRARDLDAARARADEAVRQADESLVYNPLARGEAEAVARLTEAHTALEHVATQVRGIARALADLHGDPAADPVVAALADPLEQAGTAVAAFGRLQTGGNRQELQRAHDAAAAGLEKVSVALAALPSEQDPRTLVSLYVDAGRLLHEIDPDAGAHTGAI